MTGHFEGKKHAVRQTQEGWVVSFVVHPNDMDATFATAPLGTRFMVGWAAIGDDEQPIPIPEKPAEPNPRSDAGRQRYAQASYQEKVVTRAALLPKDERFCRWVATQLRLPAVRLDEAGAADFIRAQCGVASRKDIASDEKAHARFLSMETTYLSATGQLAEMRR